jgi:hypothetical protein
MIAVKNGAMTTMTGAMTTGRIAQGPGNSIAADQTFHLKYKYTSNIYI